MWLARLKAMAQQGEVDQLIEQVVFHWQTSRKDAAWEQVAQLGCNLIKWEKHAFQRTKLTEMLAEGQNVMPPWFDVGGLKLGDPIEAAGRDYVLTKAKSHSYLIRSESILIKDDMLARNILVSAGPIGVADPGSWTAYTLYLTNDSISFSARGSIVVCDGEFKGSPHHSLIIARAGVSYGNIGACVILSGGPVRCHAKQGTISNSTIISMSTVEVPATTKVINNSLIKQNQPDALGWVKFFEPARVGIEVEPADGAVRIKKLDPARSFAKAGLHTGDLVLALDKAPVKSAESFRKLLRHGLAGQKPLTFEVQRAGKALNVSVQYKG